MWAKNKPHELAKLYLRITGKEWGKNFWGVYGFFKKQGESTLNLLHEYLISEVAEGEDITIKQLYNRARMWNMRQKETKIVQSNKVNYLEELRRQK